MKMYFMLFVSLFLAFASCKENDSITNMDQEVENKKLSRIHPLFSHLGSGYDMTGDYAHENSARNFIIDLDKVFLANPQWIEDGALTSASAVQAYGENAQKFINDFTNKLSMDTEFKVDKNDANSDILKSSFNVDVTKKYTLDAKHIYGYYCHLISSRQLKLFPNAATLKNYLNPNFVNDVNTRTPAEIVSIYGTHVLTDIVLGAKLELLYRSETTSIDRKTTAQSGISFSLGLFKINNNTTVENEFHSKTFNSSLFYKSVGGDNTKSLQSTIPLGESTQNIDWSGWLNSINKDNYALVSFGSLPMIPIYELVSDPIKKSQLKNYIQSYFKSKNIKIEFVAQPIYRYYNRSNGDHFYTKTPAQYSGYSYEGIEFYTYTYAAPNAVPIYRFWGSRDHYYTTLPGAPSGYRYEGIEFYAFTTQMPGTVPIYRYYNRGSADHFYTKTYGSFKDYVYEGIAFYAYPSEYQYTPPSDDNGGPINATL